MNLNNPPRQIEINQKETATELEQLEQYGRRENLEIHGIPINKEESTNQSETRCRSSKSRFDKRPDFFLPPSDS